MTDATALFTVTLPKASLRPITVDFTTKDGTAVAGRDYDATSGTLTFNPGDTSHTISVPVHASGASLGNPKFSVVLSNASNAVIGDGTGIATLQENGSVAGALAASFAALWAYIQRATGSAAVAANMPTLITVDGLVRNSQFDAGALGNYTASNASTSEGMALLMRGVAAAYLVDKDAAKLAYAKFLFDGLCKTFFNNTRPSDQQIPLWHHSWLANGGSPFDIRGPVPANGDLAQTGYIGVPVTFTNGVATLPHAPAILYQVVTNGTQFVWNNVLADIANGGSRLEVNWYIDAGSNKIFGAQSGLSYGQPAQTGATEAVGTVTLKDTTVNGTLLVNYSVDDSSQQIGYGELYEAWPMWRPLYSNEVSTANDAIHWFVDVFRALADIEPGNADWTNALARILDVWKLATDQDSNNTDIFKSGPSGAYNSFPLTYSYAYGVGTDGTTKWTDQPPTSRYSAARTSDGYVTFGIPEEKGTNGEDLRYGLAFECQDLFLTFTGDSTLYIDVHSDVAQNAQLAMTSAQGNQYKAVLAIGPSIGGPQWIKPSLFESFSGNVWTADRTSTVSWAEVFGHGDEPQQSGSQTMTTPDGVTRVVQYARCSYFTSDAGPYPFVSGWLQNAFTISVNRQDAYPYANWANPPGIYYGLIGKAVMVATDAAGNRWLALIPSTVSKAYPYKLPSGIYDTNTAMSAGQWQWWQPAASDMKNKDGKAWPFSASNPIQNVMIQSVQAIDKTNEWPLFPEIMDISGTYPSQYNFPGGLKNGTGDTAVLGADFAMAYISDSQPSRPSGADMSISLFTVTTLSPAAQTFKVGDAILTGTGAQRTPIQYFGALPFAYQANGPSRSGVSATPYRGPYVAGYQCGTPWVELRDTAHLHSMLAFLTDAQNQFTAAHPNKIVGPFWHCYLPATWDSLQYGNVDTWTLNSPDGNPGWSGWQYRAFEAISRTWDRAAAASLNSATAASSIAGKFLAWLDSWLTANPTAQYIPSEFGPPGWSRGDPLPANPYMDVGGTEAIPHDMALAMKGALFCAANGYDPTVVSRVCGRLIAMLIPIQVADQSSNMRGAFTSNPAGYEVYGFHCGEILEALAMAIRYAQFLPTEVG